MESAAHTNRRTKRSKAGILIYRYEVSQNERETVLPAYIEMKQLVVVLVDMSVFASIILDQTCCARLGLYHIINVLILLLPRNTLYVHIATGLLVGS